MFVILAAVLAISGSRPVEAQQADERVLLVYGDSLSAGYGLSTQEAWPALLQARIISQGLGYRVINRSLSGETTFGGLQRLERVLKKERPRVVILALGANDGLRGLSVDETQANLRRMIQLSQQADAKVLLVGIRLPPNYGPAASKTFEAMFARLAQSQRVGLVPFMLEGFAADETYFQPDRIHPTARAQPLILKTLWPSIEPLLRP